MSISFFKNSNIRRLVLGAVSVAALGCLGTTAPQSATTMYFFADYQNPNVTVTVNGSTVGQLTKQYIDIADCPTLIRKNPLDGVFSIPVRVGRYVVTRSYSTGTAVTDTLDIDQGLVESICLVDHVPAP